MKKILIIGSGGYVGENFKKFAEKKFITNIVDSFTEWQREDFTGYDSIIFAAGIAHQKQSNKNKHLYFAVNRDLAIKVAAKAKQSNVRQFIYLSSMAVYGKKEGEITQHTKPNPRHNDYYGESKYEAEILLKKLESESFKITIIRPPMVYGKNCPGKFAALLKISKWLPVVPDNGNKRSMIYINNLSRFLCNIVSKQKVGVFCPQDKNYKNTAELIKKLRGKMGKKTIVLKNLGFVVNLFMFFCPPIKTAYGSLYYKGAKDESSNTAKHHGTNNNRSPM